jgi:hypothetical protein
MARSANEEGSMSEQSPEDRVAAVERGLAALTERVERLEGEVLPRPLPDDDARLNQEQQ